MSRFIEIHRGSCVYLVNADAIQYVTQDGIFDAKGTIHFDKRCEIYFDDPFETVRRKLLDAAKEGKETFPPTTPHEEKGETNNNNPRARTRGNPFVKPTVDEVSAYVREKGYTFDPSQFIAYYDANGWKVGRNPMKDWKAACVTWQKRQHEKARSAGFARRKADNNVEMSDEVREEIRRDFTF